MRLPVHSAAGLARPGLDRPRTRAASLFAEPPMEREHAPVRAQRWRPVTTGRTRRAHSLVRPTAGTYASFAVLSSHCGSCHDLVGLTKVQLVNRYRSRAASFPVLIMDKTPASARYLPESPWIGTPRARALRLLKDSEEKT